MDNKNQEKNYFPKKITLGILSLAMINGCAALPPPTFSDERTTNPTQLSFRGKQEIDYQKEFSLIIDTITQEREQNNKKIQLEKAFEIAITDPFLITSFIAICDDRSIMEKALKIRYSFRNSPASNSNKIINESIKLFQKDHKPLKQIDLINLNIKEINPEILASVNDLFKTRAKDLPSQYQPKLVAKYYQDLSLPPNIDKTTPLDLTFNGMIYNLTNNYAQYLINNR